MGKTELYLLIASVAIGAIIYGRTVLITRSHKASSYYALCIVGLTIIFITTYNIILVIILFVITVFVGITFPWIYKKNVKNKND